MYNNDTNKYEGWIYMIQSSKTKNVYIGQTSNSVQKRWTDHLSAYKKGEQVLYKGMRKYGIESFHIESLEKIEASSNEELHELLDKKEIYYISKYDSYHNGYNMTKGGQYTIVEGYPIIAFDKQGNYLFEAPSITEMSNKTNCDITTISRCCYGAIVPKVNFIFRFKGDSFDKYRTNVILPTAKTVYCFLSDGTFFKKFDCAKDASNELNINYSRLIASINHTRLLNNYFFSYENNFNPIIRKGNKVKVDVYNFNTKNYIGTFDSIQKAIDFLGIPNGTSGIRRCLNGISEQSSGYIWRYQGDSLDKDILPKHYFMKPINMYTKQNEYIRTYQSQKSAGDDLGIDPCGINACLYNRQKTAKGYKFYFASDINQPDPTKIMVR